MQLPRLYAVTDEQVIPNYHLVKMAGEVLDAGIRMLQVRFKHADYDEQIELGSRLRRLTRLYNSLLIINDSPQLALEVEADGVHLGADDPQVSIARKLMKPDAIIGVSCYDRLDLVLQWGPDQVSYIGLSSPYTSTTKQKVTPDQDDFSCLVSSARVPVYGIGGITPERVPEMINSGCYGVAVVSAIFASSHPARAVKEFLVEIERFV